MKDPKIKWPGDSEKKQFLNATGLTVDQTEDRITRAISKGEKMAKRGLNHIQPILDEKRSRWEACWNADKTLKKWFGKVTKANHVKDVFRRLENAYDRLSDKTLTIKIKADLPNDYSAMNNGSFLSPKTFQVGPDWFDNPINERGSVVIHELLHEWFIDQKIDGEIVYGATLAKKLADKEPKKARKSPENYEHYCLDLHNSTDRYQS